MLLGCVRVSLENRNQKRIIARIKTQSKMSFLDRINTKLTEKNKAAAERPPNSELVLLLGRREVMFFKYYIADMLFIINRKDVDASDIRIDETFHFLEMRVIPVDFDEYLDIVRKI